MAKPGPRPRYDWDSQPLGIEHDREIARKLGCSVNAVAHARRGRKIPRVSLRRVAQEAVLNHLRRTGRPCHVRELWNDVRPRCHVYYVVRELLRAGLIERTGHGIYALPLETS